MPLLVSVSPLPTSVPTQTRPASVSTSPVLQELAADDRSAGWGGGYKKRAMLHATKNPTLTAFSRIVQIYIVQ